MQSIDWSDLSKLQMRGGWDIEATYPTGGKSRIVVYQEDGNSGYHFHEVCSVTGRFYSEYEDDTDEDVIPRSSAKTKTVRLCRPEFECYSLDCKVINTGLIWGSEAHWDQRKKATRPDKFGPMEYREFEVPE